MFEFCHGYQCLNAAYTLKFDLFILLTYFNGESKKYLFDFVLDSTNMVSIFYAFYL